VRSKLLHIIRSKSDLSKVSNHEKGGLSTFLNPFSYLVSRKEWKVFAAFDTIYVDGISLVLLLRLFGIKTERKSFDMTSLAPEVFKYCEQSGKTIYFIGAKQEEVSASVKNFQAAFPKMNIAGFRNGYVSNEWDESIRQVVNSLPDIVVVGMGTPIQEHYLLALKEAGFTGQGYTCGVFLHQSADGTKYYPKWADQLHLRWLYRMIDEPKLIKRYLIQYPW